MAELLLNRITLHCGDCLKVLPTLAENSIDACVTDPPYHLTSIVKRFGGENAAPAQFGKDGRFKRLSGGFMSKAWDAPDVPAIDPAFAFWMAGFIDGEGCFSVHKKNVNNCETYDCQFSMTLRADDKDIVVEMQRQLGGIGTIASRPAPASGGNPQVRYCVSSQRDCWRLREVIRVFPLRAKKARDFEIWSQALDAWIAHEPGQSWEDVAYFRDALMAVRRYGADFHPSQLWAYRWAREVYRVLKPGAHLVAFGGSRTYHRMACAIEDAGFEIRDTLMWIYGSGFPKSHSIAVAIDKMNGIEPRGKSFNMKGRGDRAEEFDGNGREFLPPYEPTTDAARQWDGWGTALKPSFEPCILARKPLSEDTVAANVLRWGTGAINVDGCRVSTFAESFKDMREVKHNDVYGKFNPADYDGSKGRWPANVIHDGSDEVVELFPETASSPESRPRSPDGPAQATWSLGRSGGIQVGHGDSGSAARYFYTAKADGDDRLGSKHPTVKPVDLMQYLVRLVTPSGGLVLDPFAGTGSTGEAAFREGMHAVLIEREAEYQQDIRRRMQLVMAGPDERLQESIKAAGKVQTVDDLPLFSGIGEAAE